MNNLIVMASELSLEFKPQQSYSMLMKPLGEQFDHTQKLEEFLSRLEEERLKIDAFKRELPLCMQLLSNAVESLRQQLQAYRVNQQHEAKPVLEEFIPLNAANSSETSDTEMPKMTTTNNLSDKSNWMTSAQLWSQTGDANNQKPMKEVDTGLVVNNNIRNGGAFLPFTKDHNDLRSAVVVGGGAGTILPELALAFVENGKGDKKYESGDEGNGSGNINTNITAKLAERTPIELQSIGVNHNRRDTNNDNHGPSNISTSGTTNNNQTHRKARRCWSADLHRRFISALQMLGGSQMATPKQIRELMKVDGLTNDEVKSHLQKYRLHTRRPSPSPQTGATAPPQLVVLGGIWVSPDYTTAAAATHGTTPGIYGPHPSSHVAPPHYCAPGPAVSQEFYAPLPPPHHEILHHHRHQQQLHEALQAQSSPDSSGRGGGAGDMSESIEDGKSESSSWKGGDSGGENTNGGLERQLSGLRARDDNELESNGSEITLKF